MYFPDCRLRTSACLVQCQNPSATPAVKSVTQCQAACNYIIGSTCGTPAQFIPEYQVSSYSDTPKLVRLHAQRSRCEVLTHT